MIKVRFYTPSDDHRPIKWPIKHPYWCSGHTDTQWVIVAYADNIEEIKSNWPEHEDMDILDNDAKYYSFTERFPRPDWFKGG